MRPPLNVLVSLATSLLLPTLLLPTLLLPGLASAQPA